MSSSVPSLSRSAFALALAISAVSSPARAEIELGLDRALEQARLHNRDLRMARARLEQTATSVEQAWVALLPQVSAQGKYTHNYKEVDVPFAQLAQPALGLAEVIKGTSQSPAQVAAIGSYEQQAQAAIAAQPTPIINKLDQLDASLTVTVPVIVPYAYKALASARQTQASNAANFDVTEAALLYSVAQAYFAAAGADELVAARKNAIEVARETFQEAKARYSAGVVNRVEITRAEVELVRAEQAEAEIEDTQAQAYRALATLLDLHEPFHVVPGERLPGATRPAADLVEQALKQRPEFAVYRRALEASASSARSAEWRWAPQLSAFGSVRASNYAGFSGDYYSWAVGAQLDWLLYDGGARDAQKHLALAQRVEHKAHLDLLRDSVTDDVINAERALGTKRRALAAAKRSFELSEETLRLVRVQRTEGTARQLDLLQAQDSRISAEVAVAQARFDLALADLLLARAAGTFPPTSSGARNE